MTIAFVLGNGISRNVIDLSQLRPIGSIYGCNALFRDFVPDCLVATDRPIAETIQNSGYSKNNRFYTRRPIPGLGAHSVPEKYHGNSSGPIACAIAALDGHHKIYMLGFDMGPIAGNLFNNVYAGSDFYKAIDAVPTFTGNWIKQIKIITKDFSKKQFTRVVGPTTAAIPELENLPNLAHISIQKFLELLHSPANM
jgi:hypothetical protein